MGSKIDITLGRADDCTLVFEDAMISGRHARIESLGDGRYKLTDLDSRNGTFIEHRGNLERVHAAATVRESQRIRFGSCTATIGELIEMAGIDLRPDGRRPSPATPPRAGLMMIRCASCGWIKPKGRDCPNPLCGQPTQDPGVIR